MKKINLALVMGGVSGEHQVSLLSAFSIWKALDKRKYEVLIVGVDEQGLWHVGKDEKIWIDTKNPSKIRFNLKSTLVWPIKNQKGVFLEELANPKKKYLIDIFFPIIHGTFGEDGTLQGFLEILDVPYVGSGVLGSSLGMDKDIMKRVLKDSNIPTTKYFSIKKDQRSKIDLEQVARSLEWPIFIKPANLGSSVGVSQAKNKKELQRAINLAFCFDNKIILEKKIVGREIECSVLGKNANAEASFPGEIKLKKGFYSYRAKYLDNRLATPVPVADLGKTQIKRIQSLAVKVFNLLEADGLARIDFFLMKKVRFG